MKSFWFNERQWKLAGGRSLKLGPVAKIMGILNVTPDSFSDGGRFTAVDAAISRTQEMIEQGADIIDIGGESTRPGADPISAEEEQQRVLPIIEALSAKSDVLISIDTYRAKTADLAMSAGAHIINDVWGFQKEPEIAKVAARSHAGCCLMHTGRERTKETDVISDQMVFLNGSLKIAKDAGVNEDAIVLDPGFGFAKNSEENLTLLARLNELTALGYPVLTGTSRKRFIGSITGRDPDHRAVGTAATSVVARMQGSSIFRVHDIAQNKDALAIADAVIRAHLN